MEVVVAGPFIFGEGIRFVVATIFVVVQRRLVQSRRHYVVVGPGVVAQIQSAQSKAKEQSHQGDHEKSRYGDCDGLPLRKG